jgi:predicted dienelactone hydrolase
MRHFSLNELLGSYSMRATWRGQLKERRRRRITFGASLLTIVATLVVPSVLIAPQSADADHARSVTQTPLFAVGLARCTFVDRTRPVINYSTTPFSVLSTSRTLVTEIRYPTQSVASGTNEMAGAPPVERSGGYPMIVFAHGYDVTPDTYAALLDAWTRAGFIVVSPFFPDEKSSEVAAQHGANTEGDLVNEPADLTFVTKAVLQASTIESASCPIVNGLVETSEIALAGHSDGATAVGMLAYDHGDDPQGINYAALRTGIDYRAVIILSGEEDSAQSFANEARRPALLVVHSLADQCNPIRNGVKLYDDIHQPNKWFLELRTAHHLPAFDGADPSAFKVVVAVSIRFIQMSLEGVTASTSLLAYGNEQPSVARMYGNGLGPTLANSPRLVESCGPN